MAGKNGGSPWFSFPQREDTKNGERVYYDQIFLSTPEREHVRRLILADLESHGHLKRQNPRHQGNDWQSHLTHEGEDLNPYFSGSDDDIPF